MDIFHSGTNLDAVYPSNPDFDFRRRVFQGLQYSCSSGSETDNALESLGSPLASLTSSAASSRPSSPSPGLLQASSSYHNPLPIPAIQSLNTSTLTLRTQPAQPLDRVAKRKARMKLQSRRNAKKKKNKDHGYQGDAALQQKHRAGASSIATSYNAKSFEISRKGYIGRRGKQKGSTSYTVEQLTGPHSKKKFSLIVWNGKTDKLISDNSGRVIGACIGVPRGDDSWNDVHRRAAAVMLEAGKGLNLGSKEKKHRRGNFAAVNVGISHGGGQLYPKMLEHSPNNLQILEGLLHEETFQRISGFTAGAFSTWAPRLYQYENQCLDKIISHDRELRETKTHPRPQEAKLRRNFSNTPWAAAAFNFGPQTVCRRHVDHGNLAFGWCAITALGQYDYTKGGHLVLWDLKLVIQFPPGSSIMIPSCAIRHSNTSIQTGECRLSFTQYSSGGIFRWIDNGYQTAESYTAGLDEEERADTLEWLAHQLERGLSLYSTVAELRPGA